MGSVDEGVRREEAANMLRAPLLTDNRNIRKPKR